MQPASEKYSYLEELSCKEDPLKENWLCFNQNQYNRLPLYLLEEDRDSFRRVMHRTSPPRVVISNFFLFFLRKCLFKESIHLYEECES